MHTFLLAKIFPFRRSGPKGYYLLRNYKRKHRDRVLRAIRRGELDEAIQVVDTAYGPNGLIEEKIAVYCRRNQPEAESLFFQFYAIEKQKDKPATARELRWTDITPRWPLAL